MVRLDDTMRGGSAVLVLFPLYPACSQSSSPSTGDSGHTGSGDTDVLRGDTATGDPTIERPDVDPGPLIDDPDAEAKLFSHDYLPVYRVTLTAEPSSFEAAWDYLVATLDPNDRCADRPFSEASVVFENPWTGEVETWDHVGFRIRGHDLPFQFTDQPDERFGYKMSFVEWTPGRRFHGHRRINFLSSERDDSLMRQCLVYDLMRDFGVPTARCNFATLELNGDYVGVFAHVEERDDGGYLRNRFPDDPDGGYYEYGDCSVNRASVFRDLGTDPQPYVDTYQLLAGTTADHVAADLIAFVQCADGPLAEFTACIDDHVFVEEWQRAIVSAIAIPEMDAWPTSGANS